MNILSKNMSVKIVVVKEYVSIINKNKLVVIVIRVSK